MLTTAPTDTESGLLRAILESPGCDNARLAYADFLEEHAGDVECPKCVLEVRGRGECPMPGWLDHRHTLRKCESCSGSGRVSNGFAERADFIRVQCEIPHLEAETDYEIHNTGMCSPYCTQCPRLTDLRQRERELWVSGNARAWFSGLPGSGHVIGSAPRTYIAALHGEHGRPREKIEYDVERGFITEVHSSLAVLVGETDCSNCGGHGRDYQYSGHFDDLPECPRCKGKGEYPGIAADLIRTQPVTTWRATDKRPGGLRRWYRKSDQDLYNAANRIDPIENDPESDIPDQVFDLIEGGSMNADEAVRSWIFPTEAEALAALSEAVATIAKQGVKG